MSRRLDLGVASYGPNHQQLERTLKSIAANSTTDWRCFVIHNPSPGDELTKEVICKMAAWDPRFVPVWMEKNVGYAGACNELLQRATTEYIGYVENDAEVITPGWDETLCAKLDAFHEIGLIFPNGGAYPIERGAYTEILWGVGFCWVINRMCATDLEMDLSMAMPLRTAEQYDRARPCSVFDERLGHQEEADVCQRVRMAGWKCAAVPSVCVSHKATATNNPASAERINRGVVNWVNKWNRYFNGKGFDYHSPNVTRFEDWPPQALYLEEYWKTKRGRLDYYQGGTVEMALSDLNEHPDVAKIDGREYDLIRVPRLSGFYRNRII